MPAAQDGGPHFSGSRLDVAVGNIGTLNVASLLSAGAVPGFDVRAFGTIVGNGIADDSGPIQKAINAASSVGGGIIWFPVGTFGIATGLTINSRNIMLMGQGANWRHTTTTTSGSTTFRGLTNGMTICQFAAPSAGGTNFGGGGAQGVYFDTSTNACAIGLEVLTWRYGYFRWLGFNNGSTAAFHCGVIGSWNDTDTRSAQQNIFEQFDFGDYSLSSAPMALFDGDTTSGLPQAGNASLNTSRDWSVFHGNGAGIKLANSDNNKFYNVRCFRGAGGTGDSIFFAGGTVSGLQSRAHTIIGFSANAAPKVEGTDTATVVAGPPVFHGYDKDNNTPDPVVGTGASYMYIDTSGLMVGFRAQGFVIGDSRNNALQALAASNSLEIYNGSAAHMTLSDNTRTGTVRINGANGPQIARLAGGSYSDLDGGLHVTGTTTVDIVAAHLISSASGTPATSNLGANVSSVTFTGNDVRGKVVIVMSGALAANTRISTCTWAATFSAITPIPLLSSETSGAGLTIVNFYSGAESATAFDLFCEQALAAGTYALRYINIG